MRVALFVTLRGEYASVDFTHVISNASAKDMLNPHLRFILDISLSFSPRKIILLKNICVYD